MQSVPDLYAAVNRRAAKSRPVCDALVGDCWIRDISGSLSVFALQQYVDLWGRVQQVRLAVNSPDRLIWKWSNNQQYSSASVYRAFFLGQ
jgi:hypothetical protein